MSYFPNKAQTKVELQESTTKFDLSCTHLTTANFFELNIAYYRENTPRERFKHIPMIFARPVPMQAPVMGEATLKVKNFFVPYRTLSPQWNDYITKTPHVPYNGVSPIQIKEMPYTTAFELSTLVQDIDGIEQGEPMVTIVETATQADYIIDNTYYKLTPFGRHTIKILNQLGYQIVVNNSVEEHFDMMPLLALAKIYLDFYQTNQYAQVYDLAYKVEALLKKDGATTYMLGFQDIELISYFTWFVMYSPDYFTSCWDNPTTPNEVATSFGNITIGDITTNMDGKTNSTPETYNGTPITQNANGVISQYMLDSLKGLTDWIKRAQLSTRAIDRYLSRFGVLLTAEKMNRSVYNGSYDIPMNFGAIYSTAETELASVGDYAGQGIIKSDNTKEFEFENLDEYGCIMTLFSINPKIGYYQGIDRQHFTMETVEGRFNGQFDALGTQAISAAELYVSNNNASIYSGREQFETIFGYLPRQAHFKVAKDRLTGDFVRKNLNADADAWHMFRVFNENEFDAVTPNMVHSPNFVWTKRDAQQYSRIFNYVKEDTDKFNIMIQMKNEALIHAKAIYDSYDFEGEGKKIIMDGQGAKQN